MISVKQEKLQALEKELVEIKQTKQKQKKMEGERARKLQEKVLLTHLVATCSW